MDQFCRTCGKTIDQKKCIKLFNSANINLLSCARKFANCWLENVTGFPTLVCRDCQKLLKKLEAFRKRCGKIEYYLTKHKKSLGRPEQQQCDPLQIEEQAAASRAKEKESRCTKADEAHSTEDSCDRQINNLLPKYDFKDQDDSNDDVGEMSSDDVLDIISKDNVQNEMDKEDPKFLMKDPVPEANTNPNRPKATAGTRTMRLGRKLIRVRMTNETHPKRILDKRQWAPANPCICEFCGRQFKDVSNMHVHLLRHTGTKNFECPQCNVKCYTLHLLNRHLLKHTEGPYPCTFCGVEYSTNSSRMRHEREACKLGRAPQAKTELIRRGERTFHCDVCDLWFLRAGNLQQHRVSNNHIENARRKSRLFNKNVAKITLTADDN